MRERQLKAIVLDDLRRVTWFTRRKENLLLRHVAKRNSTQAKKEICQIRRELDELRRRETELAALIKQLYEDNVLGRVINGQFRMLSTDDNSEQKELTAAIPEKEARLERLKSSMANVDALIEKARRYTAINELTPELLRLFIQRVEIGESSVRYSGNATQDIRIVCRDSAPWTRL